MKKDLKTVIAFFAGCLMCLMLTCYFTPTAQEREETEFQEYIDDTTLINHSEIDPWDVPGYWTPKWDIKIDTSDDCVIGWPVIIHNKD